MNSRNADPAELEQFAGMATNWWDPDGDMGPLHAINPARLRYIDLACGGVKNLRALDLGCGGGILSEGLAALGAQVTGVDLAPEVLAVAKDHARQQGLDIDYLELDAESLAAQRAGEFDLVCCLEMLEHVPDPASIVQACARLARPGGTLVFSTINRNPKAFGLAILGAEYLLGLVPKGTHDYAKFIRPSELDAWARKAGLETVDISGLRYNPILKTGTIVADDVDVNYLISSRKPASTP